MSFAQTTIFGFLGRDPSVRAVNNDTAVSFSVAVSRKFTANGQAQEKTMWWNVTLWGKRGQTAAKYLKQGSLVICTGWPETREYNDKNGVARTSLELMNADFQFAPSKRSDATAHGAQSPDAAGESAPASTSSASAPAAAPAGTSLTDDEPPF
jgi:single-strand DNA-binding protein